VGRGDGGILDDDVGPEELLATVFPDDQVGAALLEFSDRPLQLLCSLQVGDPYLIAAVQKVCGGCMAAAMEPQAEDQNLHASSFTPIV